MIVVAVIVVAMIAVVTIEPVVIVVAVGGHEPEAAADDDDRIADDGDIVARASNCQVANEDGARPAPDAIAEMFRPAPLAIVHVVLPEPATVVDVTGPVPDTAADEDRVAGDGDVAEAGAGDGQVADADGARPAPYVAAGVVVEAVAPTPVIVALPVLPGRKPSLDEDGVTGDGDIAVTGACDGEIADGDATRPAPDMAAEAVAPGPVIVIAAVPVIMVVAVPEPAVIIRLTRPPPEPIADEHRIAGDGDIAVTGAGDGDVADIDPVEPVPAAVSEAIAPAPGVVMAMVAPRPDTSADEDGVAGNRDVPGAGAGDGQITDTDRARPEPDAVQGVVAVLPEPAAVMVVVLPEPVAVMVVVAVVPEPVVLAESVRPAPQPTADEDRVAHDGDAARARA